MVSWTALQKDQPLYKQVRPWDSLVEGPSTAQTAQHSTTQRNIALRSVSQHSTAQHQWIATRHLIRTMSSSTDWPAGYPSTRHLASIAKKATNDGVALNPPAKEPLTREDQEELNFSNVRTFVRHVESAPKEVYNLVMRLLKHLVLVDKQNQKLKSKFTNYKKTNEAYVIDNTQLKAKNDDLENWLADLEKQLENTWLDKYSAPLSQPPPKCHGF